MWIYTDKATGLPKGDATISYDDAPSASYALKIFNRTLPRAPRCDPSASSLCVCVCVYVAHLDRCLGCLGCRRALTEKPFGKHTSNILTIEIARRKANEWDRLAAAGVDTTGMRQPPRMGGAPGGGGGYGGGGGRGGGGGGGGRGGPEWMCASCGNNNFAFRNSCNRCNTPKPHDGGGGGGAPGGGGGYGGGGGGGGGGGRGGREGDWMCPNPSYVREHLAAAAAAAAIDWMRDLYLTDGIVATDVATRTLRVATRATAATRRSHANTVVMQVVAVVAVATVVAAVLEAVATTAAVMVATTEATIATASRTTATAVDRDRTRAACPVAPCSPSHSHPPNLARLETSFSSVAS